MKCLIQRHGRPSTILSSRSPQFGSINDDSEAIEDIPSQNSVPSYVLHTLDDIIYYNPCSEKHSVS